jgi:uncharacterized protein
MVSRDTIEKIAREIADRFHARQVILFGSYARGDATENSDVDLLVVLDDPGPRGQRSAPILRMLAERYELPVDVIVRSRAGFARWKQVPGSLAHQVSLEGVTLHAS